MRRTTEESRQFIQSRQRFEGINKLLLEILDRVDSIREISQRILDKNAEFSKK